MVGVGCKKKNMIMKGMGIGRKSMEEKMEKMKQNMESKAGEHQRRQNK